MDNTPITDPASVLVGLGALTGLLAARYWLAVSRSIDTSGEVVRGPDKHKLSFAAMFTAFTIGLASVGYLFGRFTGRF